MSYPKTPILGGYLHMKTATGTRENVKVIEEFTSGGLKVEVLD